jgi:polyhydroxyalkanoate synthesis regulator phasin
LRSVRTTHQRIARHLESEGYEVELGESVVSFRSGRITGTVRVVEEEGTMADLLSATLDAYQDSTKGMLAYVAAPSALIDRLGIHVFRLYGLGLLTYSGDHVEEVISPRLREPEVSDRRGSVDVEERPKESQQGAAVELMTKMISMLEEILRKVEGLEVRVATGVQAREKVATETVLEVTEVLRRLQELESRVAALEGLRRLVAEVEALRARVESLAKQLSALATKEQVAVPPSAVERPTSITADTSQGFELPSFLKDNPWVEILSRKGRERQQ